MQRDLNPPPLFHYLPLTRSFLHRSPINRFIRPVRLSSNSRENPLMLRRFSIHMSLNRNGPPQERPYGSSDCVQQGQED
jgi:hypothetical protein